jgi:3'-phosphoadenosine 5'-phosphosulfate sulfotransferase (PAPS reductase)/FAD synthetase
MMQATAALGATVVYKGQRSEDSFKAPIRDGHLEGGITYRLPIENWSRDEVETFVHARVPELVPAYYKKEQTSRDCWDCTAYLHENLDRIHNLPRDRYLHVAGILDEWRRDINDETRW